MYTTKEIKIKEIKLGSISLVGINGLFYPLSSGNYFSVRSEDKRFNIINMNAENFKHLKNIEWSLYEVFNKEGKSTKGFILYNKDLSEDWYLKRPYLYGTNIDSNDFEMSFGFNNIKDIEITKENISEHLLSLMKDTYNLHEDIRISITDEYKTLEDFEKFSKDFTKVCFSEILTTPYFLWDYGSYDYMSINVNEDELERISLLYNSTDIYIRLQTIEKTIEKVKEMYKYKDFEKKIQNLTSSGVKHFFNLYNNGK